MKEKTSGSIHNNSAFKQHPLTTTQIAQPLTQYTFLCLSCQCQACKFKSAPLFCQNQKTHFMSAKQLFYEQRIMELQSILNDILSVSQVDLFWKAWPWQSDMACVTLLNFMSTAEIGGYSQYNKNYFRGFQIFWILTMWQQTHIQDSTNFHCHACCIQTKYSLYILLLPYCILNPMVLLHNGYVKNKDQTLSVGHPLNHPRKLFFFSLNLCFLKLQKK